MSKSMKRTATSELNRDNWHLDDEPEDPGIFKSVGQKELSKRVIKVARRRLPNKTHDEQKPIFANFGGFGTNKPTSGVPDTSSSFSFLSNLNGSSTQTNNKLSPTKNDKTKTSSNLNPTSNNTTTTDVTNSISNSNPSPKISKENEYLENIKELNESLLEWLDKCLKKNPSSILTPIFHDYEKHLDSLNKSIFEDKSNEQSNFKLNENKGFFKKTDPSLFLEKSSNPSVSSVTNLAKPVEPANNFKNTVSFETPNSKESSNSNLSKLTEPTTHFRFNASPKTNSEDSPKFKQSSVSNPNKLVEASANFKFNVTSNTTSENTSNSKQSPISNPFKPSESNVKFSFSSNAGSEQTDKSSVRSPLLKNSSAITNSISTLSNNSLVPPPTSSWMASSTVSKSNVFTNLASNSTGNPSSLFGLSNPFPIPSNSESKEAPKGDVDDEPPVNDFKPVTEDDALFSQRVKLFIQKDKQYTDRGVGTLFIKEADGANGTKIHQAIIRADTSIGNIIFNIRITDDIPTKRVGKNNVMLVCVPLPDAKQDKKSDEQQKPVPVLLRVKTAEEADKLMEEINKYK